MDRMTYDEYVHADMLIYAKAIHYLWGYLGRTDATLAGVENKINETINEHRELLRKYETEED